MAIRLPPSVDRSDLDWKRIRSGHTQVGSSANALTTGLHEAGANSPGGTGGAFGAFYFDPADYASADQTCKLKTRIEVLTNDVAPGITFTVSLKPVTATGGASGSTTTTLGADVTGSAVAIASPALDTRTASDLEFTAPAAGFYELALVTSGTTAASSTTTVRGSLHARAV